MLINKTKVRACVVIEDLVISKQAFRNICKKAFLAGRSEEVEVATVGEFFAIVGPLSEESIYNTPRCANTAADIYSWKVRFGCKMREAKKQAERDRMLETVQKKQDVEAQRYSAENLHVRDEFVKAAIQGLCSNAQAVGLAGLDSASLAHSAGQIADACMEDRFGHIQRLANDV